MGRTYDVSSIDEHIARIHAKVGDAPFMGLGLMALEALVREHDPGRMLPSKTLLRERLNAFRAAPRAWPSVSRNQGLIRV